MSLIVGGTYRLNWPVNPGPITQIQPFSYEDGVTFADLLGDIKRYIVKTLKPFLDDLTVELDGKIITLIEAVTLALDEQDDKVDEKLVDLTNYVNEQIQLIINNSIEVQDPVVAGLLNDPESATRVKGDTVYAGKAVEAAVATLEDAVEAVPNNLIQQTATYPAWNYGVRANGEDQTAALKLAFQAATDNGGSAVVLPPGTTCVEGGFKLAGYSAGLIGGMSTAPDGITGGNAGSVLKAINQTGPVLDFTGFKFARGMRGRVLFERFAVEGDNTAGANKKGILLDTGAAGSAAIDLSSITIYNTGGAALHVKDHYLSEFTGVTLCTPVNASANNTPYAIFEGSNGNRIHGLGIRSLVFNGQGDGRSYADVGVGGAVVLLPGTNYQQHQTLFTGMWFENNHLPENGTLVRVAANNIVFSDTQFFDIFKASTLTGEKNTSYFRFEVPEKHQNFGGNIVRGLIPGRGNNTTEVDRGIDMFQSNNRVEGVKGNGGRNVRLNPGVNYTTISLGGATVAGNNVAVEDASATLTNTYEDNNQGLHVQGGRSFERRAAGIFQDNKVTQVTATSGNIGLPIGFGSNVFIMTLTGAANITNVTGDVADAVFPAQAGRELIVIVKQDAVGGRTLAWGSRFRWQLRGASNAAPAISAGANTVSTFKFVYDGEYWRELSSAIGSV